MQLRLGLTFITLSVLAITGCSTLGHKLAVNNGSLDYKKATTLEPLKYPEVDQVRPATPLYPAPTIDPLALQHAPDFENQKGNRFAMPRPGEIVANRTSAKQGLYVRPTVLFDAQQNPLLKVSGKPDTIWQYTLGALNHLNYQVTDQSRSKYQATIQGNDGTYIIKLSAVGKDSTIVLFNPDNSFADQTKAKALLDQISQNWPA